MKIKFFLLVIIYSMLFSCTNLNEKGTVSISNENKVLNSIETTNVKSSYSNNENLEEVIQKAIDLAKLQQYYHINEIPNRFPLIILKNDKIPSILKLNKFGKQVEILDESTITKQNKAYLVFSKTNITENTASIHFSYPIEGIRVRIEFIKKDNKWLIKESELVES